MEEKNNGLSESQKMCRDRQSVHVKTPQINIWLFARCTEACYGFLYNHLFDISDSTLKKIATIGNSYLTKYEAKQNRLNEIETSQGALVGECPYLTQQYGMLDAATFHQTVDEVLFFASNTAASFSKNYSIDEELVHGLAAAFMMPYFYWQLFSSLKIKVGGK